MKHGLFASVIIAVLVLGGCNDHFHELITPDDNKILSFTVPGQTEHAVITENSVSVTADKDTDIRSLIPKVTVSRMASLLPLTFEYIQEAFPSANVFSRAAEMYTRDDFADHLFDLIREDKYFNVPKLTIPIDFSVPVDFFVISGKGNICRYTVYVTKGINPVTITGLGAADKIYDGTTTATVTGTAVIEGLIPGDTVTVNYGTAEFEDAAVGYNKIVTFSGFSLSGADAWNYTLTAQPESVTAAIFEQSNLIAFANPEPHIVKTYGDAAFTNAITNAHSGSGAITYSSGDETVATVDNDGTVTMHKAGTTTITARKVADAGYAGATRSYILTVEPKPVTISGLGAADKIYDGTTTATVTGTAVIEGLIPGDTVTVNYGTAAFESATKDNNKTVIFSGFSLGGADAESYTLTAQPESVTAAILGQSDLIAFADPAPNIVKTYGDAAFTNAITDDHSGSGAITYSSEDETVATVDDDGTVTMHKAGTTTITARKAADVEYAEATRSYILTVEPKPITISVRVTNKTYDGTTSAAMASAALIVGRESGDEVTVNNGTATFADKNVGNNKTVIFSGFSLGGADAGNYTLSAQPTATANIFAKPITISSPSRVDNKVYDGTTTATINRFAIIGINDVISGDTVTANNGTATFADKNVGNNKTVTFSGFSLGGADAGNYSLSAQPASVTANITAKSVTITGLTAANKVYDRTTTATRTGTATINGLIGGDTVTVNNGTVAFENATVGNNKTVIFSGFSLGGTAAGNYSLSAQPTATANITAKPVTITGLTAANKQYDGTTTATRTGTATLNGVISGDTVTINYGTAAFASATAGNNKTVTFSGFSLGGASAGNYSLSAQPASVTANITVIAIDMVRLSNGSNVTFQMGSPTTEAGRNDENETRHQVTLATGFYMGKYQVTQTQYQMVMGNNPSSFTSGANTGEIQEKRPVERVSWYDAIAFCNKLSMLEGYTPAYRMNGTTNPDADAWGTGSVEIVANSTGYRLPTEAQWEYACRAGTTTAYHTGASISDTTGWYNGNGGNKTHEVGKKTANTLGLYDMHGNVAEWCWDWYADNYGGTGAQTNPTGPSSGTNRVRRGGSFSDSAANVRSASRSFAPQTGIYNIIGFRLVRP